MSRGRPARPVDLAVNAVTLVVMALASALHTGALARPSSAVILLGAVSWLPLLARTRWPEPALIAVVLVEVLHLLVLTDLGSSTNSGNVTGAYQPIPVPALVAVFTVAARRRARESIAIAFATCAVLVAAAVVGQSRDLLGTDVVMVQLILIATGVGVVFNAQAELRRRRAADIEAQTRRAILDERLRIARELHDTLAHNLTLIDAQASVAEYLMASDPHAARTALRGITQHTGGALEDLRASLLLLRSPSAADDPTDPTQDLASTRPLVGLADLDALLEQLRRAGSEVDLDVVGIPSSLSHQSDLAAYRIVQEALTNAAKHAPGALIAVELRWGDDALEIEIINAPSGPDRPVPGPGTGHGLLGLAERARSAGGELDTRRTANGGWLVRALLPYAGPTIS